MSDDAAGVPAEAEVMEAGAAAEVGDADVVGVAGGDAAGEASASEPEQQQSKSQSKKSKKSKASRSSAGAAAAAAAGGDEEKQGEEAEGEEEEEYPWPLPPWQPTTETASASGGLAAGDAEADVAGGRDGGPPWRFRMAALGVGATAYAWVLPRKPSTASGEAGAAGASAAAPEEAAGEEEEEEEEEDADDVVDRSAVVLCHGINFSAEMSFGAIAPAVATATGLRVLVFDFLGRGRSASPRGVAYTPALLVQQLHQLLSHEALLGEGRRLHVAGLSMGGVVATHFAAQYPELVTSLTLLAPAVVPMPMPFTARLLTVPMLGGALFSAFGKAALLQRLREERLKEDFRYPERHKALIDDFVTRIEWTLEHKANAASAFHSTLQNFRFDLGHAEATRTVAQAKLPTLIVFGDNDGLMPLPDVKAYFAENDPDAPIHVIDDMSHGVTIEAARECAQVLAQHITKNKRAPRMK